MSDLNTKVPKAAGGSEKTPPKRFSNREAEKEWSGHVTTRAGLDILITPARPSDHDALVRFFDAVTPADIYFRFLSGMRKVDEERLQQMIEDDNDRTIDFLAVDPESGEILSSAMLGADEAFENADFAVCTREDMKHKGISWALLSHATRYAEAMGVKKISSVESAHQKEAIKMEWEMGFKIKPYPDDPSLILVEKTF